MKIEIYKRYEEKDNKLMLNLLEKKYGNFEKLKKEVMINRCNNPDAMDDYILWRCINKKEKITEKIIIENSKFFNTLTARRTELIDFLNDSENFSIRDIAHKLKRNYKNVYDDMKALEDFFILETVPSGRNKIPLGKIEKIDIMF